ncbi:Protein transport protein sec9 [Daldinia childiae]|uniref:Protein transport protein sec9 n=1 Tax=Daldinia childiae TaxID=326645 RepID=UPI001445B482|nr:Protein transport protein sec9 [Daldinia childiae]KAF3055952.1 Protein transport protein sec9 [Daldinia childiae]
MRKFGFGRKHADGDDDANRSALFGKKGSPAPPSDNPYAQPQPANDPYTNDSNKYAHMTPYQQARARLPDSQVNGLPSKPSPQNGYAAPPPRNDGNNPPATTQPPSYSSGGYSNNKYGAPSGYGENKYSNSNGYGARSGGYGGLGRTDSNNTDTNRDALFSGARERYDQRQPNGQDISGASGASGIDSGNKYGGYGEQRELTAEEQEEVEVDDIKRQIKEERLATVGTTQNIARTADQALDVAMQTVARLGGQTERLNYTETLIDKGSFASREAEQSTKKLKSLNRSMFAVHVGNPFTATKRQREIEQKALDEHRSEREIRETTRKEGYMGNQRMEATFREAEASANNHVWKKQSAAERSKYAFEDDDDDEVNAQEDEIDDNMELTARRLASINHLAHNISDIVDTQNKTIDRIGSKSDQLSDETVVHTRRLQTIR